MTLTFIVRFVVLVALAATSFSLPAATTLSEGDPAPKLSISKWIQGEPVESFKPGTVYLVNFWSTWWTPAHEPLAHVNRLHKKYKDKGLVVIGQNVKEAPGTKVDAFVKRMGDLISYRVAIDDRATNRYSGKMLENWLYASETGVPTAFVIDKQGKISFIGHPEEIDEQLIDQVLAGTFDARKRAQVRAAMPAKDEEWETHNDLGKAAWKAKQWDKAMKEIEEMEKLYPYKRSVTQCLRITVFMGQENFDAAGKLAIKISDENRDDPFMQNRIARTIANRAPTDAAILEKATQIMGRATALLKGPEPQLLHTQARLAFLQGKKEKALQLETEALNLADPLSKEQFTQGIKDLKKDKLPQ